MLSDKKAIIKKLYSRDDKEVIELLDKLKPVAQKDIVPELIKLLDITESHKIKHKIALIFYGLKDQRTLPALVKEIQKPYNRNYRGTFVFACEVFDCSQYITDFLKLVVDDNYEVAMTAALVVENMKGPFRKNKLLKYVAYLEKKFNQEETPKKEIIEEVLEYLHQYT